MLTKEGLNLAASRIFMIQFFPAKDNSARALILAELGSMCESDAHAQWLSIRAEQVFKEWPGVGELRALYCKRFRPSDGREMISSVYPDGFPTEKELGKLLIPGLPEPPAALPEAPPKMHQISASPEMCELVAEVAAAAKIPERKVRTIAEIEAELYKKHPVPGPRA